MLKTPEKQTAYERDGFKNRAEYLANLADNYGSDIVYALADALGPNEDFDGLISELEDYSDLYAE